MTKTNSDRVQGFWLDVGWVYAVVSVMCDVVTLGQVLNIYDIFLI